MYKILSTILYTVFIAIVVGIAGLLLGTMLPIPGNIEVKIVKSGSMEPVLPTGSLIFVKRATFYTKGDIVTFGKDTKTDIPTTHRIIAVNDDGTFTTKGDANEEEDQVRVAPKDVIGEVIFHVPGAGFVLDFARQPIGFTLLVAIPAGLVIVEEILTIVSEAKKWMRRRRDDDDERGTPVFEDLSSHLRRVYEKRRAMDEIKVAMYVEPRFGESGWWKHKLGLGNDAYKTSTGLTVGLIFLSTLFAGHSGGTVSYFQDIERSVNNILTAGEWEDATPEEEVPITPFAALTVEEGDVPPEEGAVLGESVVTDEGGGGGSTPPEEDAPEDTPQADEPADPDAPPAPPPASDAPGDATPPVEPPADEPAEDEPAEPEPTPEPPPADPEPTPEPPADEPESPVVE
jgi:signal peptidase